MVGGKRRDHGQLGQDGFEREHRLDALARQKAVSGAAEADAMTEQDAQDLARRVEVGDRQALDIEPGPVDADDAAIEVSDRSEEHTSELQSLMRISYAVFCSKKKK